MSPQVVHVCTSAEKGIAKKAVAVVELRANHGVCGDAHAGESHRQVSLLEAADIAAMGARGIALEPGAFGENLVVDGVDFASLGIGSRLRVGDAELEVTQIGKACHHRCAIYDAAGDCIMPRCGIFARVLEGGTVGPGTPVSVSKFISRDTLQAAVLTVSDRCSAGEARDTAGPAVARLIEERLSGHIASREMVADEVDAIQRYLKECADCGYALVCTVGGTGIGPRDLTPEATREVLTREIPGLAEAMRAASMQVTPHAMLQRGVCGVRGETLIVNLPGSERAAVENLTVILRAIPHARRLLRGEDPHPAPPAASDGG